LPERTKRRRRLPVRDFPDHLFVFSHPQRIVKKTPLSEYSEAAGQRHLGDRPPADDELVDARLTDGQRDIMLFSQQAWYCFAESYVRPWPGRA
jgi:DNA gyrase/topoisomerase IV subunit A